MKIIIASTPATGHLNPLLSIARMLVADGHEVVGMSASSMRDRIEAVGATFYPFPAKADFDLRAIEVVFPELKTMPPGAEMTLFLMKRAFFDSITAQHEGLQTLLREFRADVVIGDNFFYGVLPMLLGPRASRPAVIICGTMFLHMKRDDGAPNFAGILPAVTKADLDSNAAIFLQHEEAVAGPALKHLNSILSSVGASPLEMNIFDIPVMHADAFLQLTVPGFEYPRTGLPKHIKFAGAIPIIPNQVPLPEWAGELDGSKKVVLVTQGTFSNHNLGQLIGPTLEALSKEPNLLIVVTTGGRPLDAVPGVVPDNARVATYLPFEWLLPKVDVFVTNGGYGSINQALSFGVPIVSAGLTEDKADVNARVSWSGVGIDLQTTEPLPEAIRIAVREVLQNPKYRGRAKELAAEYAAIDTRSVIEGTLNDLTRR